MKLTEAIEVLKSQEIRHRTGGDPDYHDAIALGIEALKREKRFRFMHPIYNEGLLPRETEE